MVFDCSDPSSDLKSSSMYITAQIDVKHIGTGMNFTVGDGLYYGGFLNVPLKNGRDYYIFLRAVSQWKMVGETIIIDFIIFLIMLFILNIHNFNICFPSLRKALVFFGLK